MDAFARFAFFKVACDAFFAALAAAILMFAYRSDFPLALVLGASVAMFFTTVMLGRALFLTEQKLMSTEPWMVMQPEERPIGASGIADARERLETMMLGAARTASGIAAAMFGLGLLLSWA